MKIRWQFRVKKLAQNWHTFADDTQREMCYSCIVQNCGQAKSRFREPIQGFSRKRFFNARNLRRKEQMTQNHAIGSRLSQMFGAFALSGSGPGELEDTPARAARFRRILYWSLVAVAAAFILSLQPALAADVWTEFTKIMKDIYGKLVGISTIVAVTASAVALLVRMISRNQRAVDEASSWLKRILVTWVVLNTLGFIVAYLQPLIAGGGYTGP
jgi:hypothetical protein